MGEQGRCSLPPFIRLLPAVCRGTRFYAGTVVGNGQAIGIVDLGAGGGCRYQVAGGDGAGTAGSNGHIVITFLAGDATQAEPGHGRYLGGIGIVLRDETLLAGGDIEQGALGIGAVRLKHVALIRRQRNTG